MKEILMVLAILLLFPLPLYGEGAHILLEDLFGEVLHRGSAFYSTYEPAVLGMDIYPGEVLRVGEGSYGRLLLPYQVHLLIEGSMEVHFSLAHGKIHLDVFPMNHGETPTLEQGFLNRLSFQVETGSAVAAIRGLPLRQQKIDWVKKFHLLGPELVLLFREKEGGLDPLYLLQIGQKEMEKGFSFSPRKAQEVQRFSYSLNLLEEFLLFFSRTLPDPCDYADKRIHFVYRHLY